MYLYVTTHGHRPDLAAKVADGIRTTIEWKNVFPTRESYERGEPDFSDPERELRPALDLGLGVIPILSTAPAWAGGGEQGIRVGHLVAWSEFTRTMASAYPEISQWQIWNEAGHESDTVGVGWKGDPREALTRLYIPQDWPKVFIIRSPSRQTEKPIFGGLARPGWRSALILRKMRDYGASAPIPSFHLNGGDHGLDVVLKRLRRFLAMRQVFGLKGPWVVTECGWRNLRERWPDLLRLLAVLEAAGCSLAAIYQLLDQGEGDGLFKRNDQFGLWPDTPADPDLRDVILDAHVDEPEFVPVSEELHARLAARDYGPVRPEDLAAITPRAADRLAVRLLHLWGLVRCATGTEGW